LSWFEGVINASLFSSGLYVCSSWPSTGTPSQGPCGRRHGRRSSANFVGTLRRSRTRS
jgi:hypothetical protein